MIKKVLLYYPYGKPFQRGEDRSQGEIEHSSATSIRAANDLGYMAAVLRKIGVGVKIRDYMTEKKEEKDFIEDLQAFKPDMIVASMTTATLLDDLKTFSLAKKAKSDIITVAKGAYFFAAELEKEESKMFEPMDYALVGECETLIDKLVEALNLKMDVSTLKGIIWKKEGVYISNGPADFVEDLDSIPFPARDLMNNILYMRPDTGEPQATIQVDRGCPFACTYCLTPLISGRKLRRRTVNNILDEIKECINKYKIKNFFFKSDTFTADRDFVHKLCDEIIKDSLKIKWVANSRVKPIDLEILRKMKKAGAWLVAFGIESGNDETLRSIKKGSLVEDAVKAVKMAKQADLRIYGFFLLGFPWETEKHLEDTFKLAKKLKLDYYEFHICVFYPGTPIYAEALREGLFKDSLSVVGKNYFTNPSGTKYLSKEAVLVYRRRALMSIYVSPWYVIKRLKNTKSLTELKNNIRYGMKLILNLLRS